MKGDISRMNKSKNVVTFPPPWVILNFELHSIRNAAFLKLFWEGEILFSSLIHQSRKLDYTRSLISRAESKLHT